MLPRVIAGSIFIFNTVVAIALPSALSFLGLYLSFGSILIAFLDPWRFVDDFSYGYLNHVGMIRAYIAYRKESALLIEQLNEIHADEFFNTEINYNDLSVEQLNHILVTVRRIKANLQRISSNAYVQDDI